MQRLVRAALGVVPRARWSRALLLSPASGPETSQEAGVSDALHPGPLSSNGRPAAFAILAPNESLIVSRTGVGKLI